MKWYFGWIINQRGKAGVLVVLVIVISILAGSQVGFDEDPHSTFRRNDSNFQELESLYEDFGSDYRDLLIILQGDSLFAPQGVDILRNIVREAESIEGVDSVLSLAGIRRQGKLVVNLLPVSNNSVDRLQRARREALEHPVVAGHFLSSDGKTTLLVLRLTEETAKISQFERIVAQVREITRAATQGSAIEARVTGLPAVWGDTLANARRETLKFTFLGAVLSTLIAMFLFRRPAAVLITVAGPITGVILTIGAMGMVGENLNGINAVVPTLLLVVGFTDAVHLVIDIRFSLAAGRSRSEAAWAAIKHLGPACALASLTTAIAFASLTLANTELVRRFGIVCCCGTALTFLSVITLVPLLTAGRLGSRILPEGFNDPAELESPRLNRLAIFLLNHPRAISTATIVLITVLLATALQLRPECLTTEFIPDNCETTMALAECDKAFGGGIMVYVVVQWPEWLELHSREVQEVTSAIHGILEKEPLTTSPFSVCNVLRSLPGSGDDLGQRVSLLRRIPLKFRDRMVRPDRNRLIVTANAPNIGASETQPAFLRIQRELAELQDRHPGFKLVLTGTYVVASQNVYLLVGDLARSLGLAAVLVFAVVAIALRSLRLGLVSVIPNAFPLLFTASVLVWSGQSLRVASVVSFSLCLGLAVDDTIHLLMRFNRERCCQSDVRSAIVRSMSSVGIAVVMTSMILSAGFGVMMLSFMPAIRDFAFFCLLAILSALLGDLLILPPLLYLFGPPEKG
ncbi:MAG: MMPL family transporter [Pirellulales bacterium]|nr:MMPL family transporter [Pirellulales bacterium]